MNQPTSTQITGTAHLPRVIHGYDANRAAADDERWMSFSDLLRIAKLRWQTIAAAAGTTVALTAIVMFLMTPLYMGTALVMVDEQQSHVVDDPSVLSGVPSDPSSIASQVQVLNSHALAGQVVDRLKLVDDPEFNGQATGIAGAVFNAMSNLAGTAGIGGANGGEAGLEPHQRLREKAIDKFMKKFDAYSLGHSTVIEVDFRSWSASKAARIANAMAETYVRDQIDEAVVQQYKVDNGLVDTSSGTSVSDQQLNVEMMVTSAVALMKAP